MEDIGNQIVNSKQKVKVKLLIEIQNNVANIYHSRKTVQEENLFEAHRNLNDS